jgi:hypothetical protein
MRDVLDFRLLTAPGVDGGGIYYGYAELENVRPAHSFEVAVQSAIAARDNPDRYFDVHCLAVQAGTFARLMEQLAMRGLLPLACKSMVDTAPPLFEFYAFLTPCDDAEEAARSWRDVQATLHDPLPGSAAAKAAAAAADALTRAAELERALVDAEAARKAVEAQLDQLRNSLSWRLTEPLRQVRSRLGSSKPLKG